VIKSIKIDEKVHKELKYISWRKGESIREIAEAAISGHCKRIKNKIIKEEDQEGEDEEASF